MLTELFIEGRHSRLSSTMRLRESKQVDYIEDAELETEPLEDTYKSGKITVSRSKDPASSTSSDEIEASEVEESQKPDTISDDSSNPEDELPVASKVTGRIRHKRRKTRKNRHGLSSDDDDFRRGEEPVAKKAAPANSLLKYLKANVSNVADPPSDPNAGYDSDLLMLRTQWNRQFVSCYRLII